MTQKLVTVPQLAWHEPKELGLHFPVGWDVETLHMNGFSRPPLTAGQIRDAIMQPLYGPPLRELACSKDEVAIIFDDMTRVTRVSRLIPPILEDLFLAGVPKSQVRFIAALGCHGALNRTDFVKKLSPDVVAGYPVYNHNCYENCVYAGTTSGGIPLHINAEVMNCSVKIGIGAITPHIMAGFGGGGKIVLPGVASLSTAEAFHNLEKKAGQRVAGEKGNTGMGVFENNPLQKEIQEAAGMAGLNFIVNCLLDYWGETVGLYAGEPAGAFTAGAAEARTHYLTPTVTDADVAVANAYAKAGESLIGVFVASGAVSDRGGDVVLVCNVPEGQVSHYLMGTFGQSAVGRLRLAVKVPPHVRRLIILNEYPEYTARNYFAEPEKIFFASSWDEVLRLLLEEHGNRARVVVYPDATIQYAGI